MGAKVFLFVWPFLHYWLSLSIQHDICQHQTKRLPQYVQQRHFLRDCNRGVIQIRRQSLVSEGAAGIDKSARDLLSTKPGIYGGRASNSTKVYRKGQLDIKIMA